ncbi:MAG: hypothetical protein IKA09_13395 [Lachnospiraceae bacterium]|nr:hypothetical protein [Lachnospiraceae bacterium]
MKERIRKRDAGTIFNPVMFLVILVLTAQLMMLFVEYKRVTWVSEAVTDSMTDALLGACTLNEEELYHYGRTGELEILYPKEKYDLFRNLLCEELGLTEDMKVTDHSTALLTDNVTIKDFRVYSVRDHDITLYDFDEKAGYTTVLLEDMAGVYDTGNGEVIEQTTLLAEITVTIKFMGVPVKVNKYHMVDMTN